MSVELLTLKLISPMALHGRRASEQFAVTLDYIPGGTIRGALAERYLQGNAERADEASFRRIFLTEEVAFSDFLPSTGHPSRLFPQTAMSCKRFGEHRLLSQTDSLLWLELLADLTDELDILNSDFYRSWRLCPVCRDEGRKHGKRDRFEGGYYHSVEQCKPIDVPQRLLAQVAINRRTGAAAHGLLFSHQVIEESGSGDDQETVFKGTISMPEDLQAEFEAVAPIGGRLAAGYGRSRGFGQLEVISWTTPAVERQTLRQRWQELNKTANLLWSQFNRTPPGQYFSLTLQSHLLLKDMAGQPVLEDVQATDLGLPGAALRRRCVLRAAQVSGWSTALELPKPDVWALGRGSVLLFRLPAEEDPTPVLQRLEEIELDGVGDRRAEGFGRVIACDPYHYYFTLNELQKEVHDER